MPKAPDCHICLMPCDPQIHAATERLREWNHARLLELMEPLAIARKVPRPLAPGGGFPVKNFGMI